MAIAPVQDTTPLVERGGFVTRLWSVWFDQIRRGVPLSGTGSPENVVTAPVGTLYTRIDGGAGTTLYVKESGAGNTGWVGK